MPARSRNLLRLRSALAAAGFTTLAATASAFLTLEVGAAAAAGAGLAVAAAAGAAAWAVLAPLARLSAAAQDVADGRLAAADFPAGNGELVAVAAAVRALDARLAESAAHAADLGAAYRNDLTAVAASVAGLADPAATPATPSLAGRHPAQADAVRAALHEAGKEVAGLRQRLGTAVRIINALPTALVVTDPAGQPRYLNPVAERVLGTTQAAALGKPLTTFLADPPPPGATGVDPDVRVAGAAELAAWVQGGAVSPLVVRTAADLLVEFTGSVSRKSPRDVLVCLVGRELTAARQAEAEDRAAVRGNATRQLLDRYLEETDESLRQVAAQLRLLAGDAKQSGQRDALLGKLAAAGQGLRRLETYQVLARGFRDLIWTGLPAPTPSEFMAVEVVNAAGDRLAGRFKARGNSLKVIDQGGWLYADADRIEAALLGLLTHACDAVANARVEVQVRRHGVSADRAEAATEFYIPDAGPVPPAAALAVVEHPFGALAPAPLDRFDGVGGCPLGLVVGFWMASALDGQLAIETQAGVLGLRLTVPTRVTGGPPLTVATAAPGALEVAPAEETVAGWRLGVPTAQLPA
ncbi:MAG: hypothetical protein U0804_28355 [Gemmataceae bacterium]